MTSQPGSEQAEHTEQWGGIERSEERCIELSIPARPELWSLVRMAVGSVAAAIGFDFETIADLRLALDELCNACAVGATSSSVLSLICHWNEAGLYVDCSVSFIGPRTLRRPRTATFRLVSASASSPTASSPPSWTPTG